ncbi:unnamed protein product, partial [Effrenium voratum]
MTTAEATQYLRELLVEAGEDFDEAEQVYKVLQLIKSAEFNPDAKPAEAIRQALGQDWVMRIAGSDGALKCGRGMSKNLVPASVKQNELADYNVCKQTLCVSELKARVERADDELPRKMPLAERMSRLENQKKRLTGIIWTSQTEPSHALLDRVMQMQENGTLGNLAPTQCTSRQAEINGTRSKPELIFDSSGNLKMTKRQMELECNTDGDLALQQAFQRRSLAFDQDSRGKLTAGTTNPLDSLMKQFADDPE